MADVQTVGLREFQQRLQRFPEQMERVVYANFQVLGVKITRIIQSELRPVKYTGALERSVSSAIDSKNMRLETGPTARHGIFIHQGTPPHWAPIAPLKKWAHWKLGDERLAYPVQRAIARRGTSEFARRLYGTMANPFLVRTIRRGDFITALANTSRRLGVELGAKIVRG